VYPSLLTRTSYSLFGWSKWEPVHVSGSCTTWLGNQNFCSSRDKDPTNVRKRDDMVTLVDVCSRTFGVTPKPPWVCGFWKSKFVYYESIKENLSLRDRSFLGCLLLIDKVRGKDKTYIWVSVRWKTENQSWGIYGEGIRSRLLVLFFRKLFYYYETIKRDNIRLIIFLSVGVKAVAVLCGPVNRRKKVPIFVYYESIKGSLRV
jgi:hypothetical protein